MLKLKKVAITGGIASGKTAVCQQFQKLGAYVVNADAIVHELLNPQTDLGQKVIRILGSDILKNGNIDRSLVAEKVFKDQILLQKLEAIVHPAVIKRVKQRYQEARKDKTSTLFVAEIPLLFEIGLESWFDETVAVIADEKVAKERYQNKGHTSQEYDRRMQTQLSPKIKSGKAHYTINNNGTLEDLHAEVGKLYAKFTTKNRSLKDP